MIYTFACASPQQGLSALLQLTEPQGDPFAQDWVVCPHPESARWVSQQLAIARGVRAQLEVYPTSRWVNELQATLWPRASQQPTVSRLAWAILRGGSKLASRLDSQHELAKLFKDDSSASRSGRALAGRRLRAAQHLARQLRRLLLTRPHWLQAWERASGERDDALLNLPKNEVPWPALWREVSRALGTVERRASEVGDSNSSWSDWLETLCRLASRSPSPLTQTVRRIILFGHHRYDAQTLALARACSESVEVGLITIDPQVCAPLNAQRRAEKPEVSRLVGAPLLTQAGQGFTAHHSEPPEGPHDLEHTWLTPELLPTPPFPVSLPSPQRICELSPELMKPRSLLHALQADLSRDRDRPKAPRDLSSDFSSLRFHSSYSDQRQVEDLYQTLLGAFRRDPTLRPRDVLVLCPDLERFSPLILAVFNGGVQSDQESGSHNRANAEETGAPKRLGAEVARPHGHNPFASLLTSLLSLVGGRLYRYDVFELLKSPLVSARFSLSLSEILKLEQWTRESGVRWGMDTAHRAACGLGGEAQHSWEFGLDRLLMGTLFGGGEGVSPRSLYRGVAPMSVGDQAEEQLLSRFMEFFTHFKTCREQLRHAHTPAEWCDLLIDALRSLCLASGSEARALRQDVEADLYRSLKRGAPTQQRLTPRAVRAIIEESVGKQRAVIGGGRDHVRFYPLDQAYSVPARVLCFLNMSEGRFPARHRPDPLDPMNRAPLPTDLDLMHEQSSNLLSSLLAAQEQVHFFYNGQKSGSEDRAPAPLVQAIQEEVKGRFLIDERAGERLIDELTTRHPLHSFSARNFLGDHEGVATEETLSHEPLWLAGARAWREALRDPHAPPSFSGRGLDVAMRGVNKPRVDTLRQLLKNPSEFFLKRGVGMRLMRDEELSRERELLELDHLQSWSLKDRMFNLLRSLDESTSPQLIDEEDELGAPLENSAVAPINWETRSEALMGIVRAEGLLPVGRMGEVSFEQTLAEVRSLYERFDRARGSALPTPLTLTVPLPSGRSLQLEGDQRYGDRLIFTTPSRYQERSKDEEAGLRGERIIEPWLYHVALSASGVPYSGTTLIARDGDFHDFPPLTMRRATELLERWTDLLEDGALRPLRFDPGLSWRWANALANGESEADAWTQLQDAGAKWRRADDAYVQQVFGAQEMWGTRATPRALDSDSGSPHSDTQPLSLHASPEREVSGALANEQASLPEEERSSEVTLRVHPDFAEHAQLIFGDLAEAMSSAVLGEERGL